MQRLLATAFFVGAMPAQWQAVDAVPQIVQFSGFETGDFSEFAVTNGTVSVQSALVRSGNHAMRCIVAGDGYAYASLFRSHPDVRP